MPEPSSITSLRAIIVELPFKRPFITSRKHYLVQGYVLVEATAASGLRGYGESRPAPQITGETSASMVEAINNHFAAALAGISAFDIAAAHKHMDAVLCNNTAAKCAVDIALYDLAGKLSSRPVYSFLGGRFRDVLPTSRAIGLNSVKEMQAEAVELVARGHRTLKLKTGKAPEDDIAMIRTVREAVGPEIMLKVDANQAWTVDKAAKVMLAVEDQDIAVVEQPLPAWDFKGSAELRRRIPQPVMLDESIASPQDVFRAAELGAADFINIKLLKTGGLYHALKVSAAATAAGMECQVGTLDTSIGSAAAAHFCLSQPSVRFIEIVGPLRLERDVATGLTVEQGNVVLASGPGLGLNVDETLFV